MKISVTLSVIGIVVAEIVAGRSGLGYLLLFASSRLDMGFSLAILLVLALWGGAIVRRDRLAGAADDLLARLTRRRMPRRDEGPVDRDADGPFVGPEDAPGHAEIATMQSISACSSR